MSHASSSLPSYTLAYLWQFHFPIDTIEQIVHMYLIEKRIPFPPQYQYHTAFFRSLPCDVSSRLVPSSIIRYGRVSSTLDGMCVRLQCPLRLPCVTLRPRYTSNSILPSCPSNPAPGTPAPASTFCSVSALILSLVSVFADPICGKRKTLSFTSGSARSG